MYLKLGAFLGKFVYIQPTILPYCGSIPVPYVDWEGWRWRFEESVSWLQVYLSAVDAKKWSPLREWDSLTTVFHGKFPCTYLYLYLSLYVYIYITVIITALHHVTFKWMSCHKAIVVITGRVHSIHDCVYITLILLLWDLGTLCVMDHLWSLTVVIVDQDHCDNVYKISVRNKRDDWRRQ